MQITNNNEIYSINNEISKFKIYQYTDCSLFSLTATPTAVSTVGGSDGKITLSSNENIASYYLNGGSKIDITPSKSATISGLYAGAYEVKVVNENGCELTQTIEVKEILIKTYFIQGNVWESLKPAKSGKVLLYNIEDSQNAAKEVSVNSADGSFEITGIVAGKYRILGTTNSPYLDTYYGDVTDWESAYTFELKDDIRGLESVDIYMQTSSTAVKEINSSSIKIYPNPVQDILNIDFDKTEIKIEIVNNLGQIILKDKSLSNTTKLDVHNLPKGVYILKLIDKEGNVYLKKFVK